MERYSFSYERVKLLSGFDGKECKICPRLVKIAESMYLTYGMLSLEGSDVFNDTYFVKSADNGKTFNRPEKMRRLETVQNGIRTIFAANIEYYSKHHKKWFVFGRNTSYENEKEPILWGGIAIGEAGYIFRDEETGHYIGDVQPLPLPFSYISAAPHAQIVEYENGDFLLTYYITPKDEVKSKALAVRYRYENDTLTIVQAGEPLAFPNGERGLAEPSVVKLNDCYYMTLRTDAQGLLSTSSDGLNYSQPVPWKWDDGSILPNYNTMQRWICCKNQLFLAYTRRGANNDHVFRHRAPIFVSRFDEKNMCLVKETEQILVPELGARLGNFTVTDISKNEIWLLTAEWMQPIGCEKYGSDNSIWIAKLYFE